MKGIILIVLLLLLMLVAMAPTETSKQCQPMETTFTIGRPAIYEYSSPVDIQAVPEVSGSDSQKYSRVEI